MIKYASYAVTFAEVPDEVCLTIQVTNCPCRCDGCHSAYLQQDIGADLEKDLPSLLEQYKGRVTCVCFMGSGNDLEALARCVGIVHGFGLRVAIYTGNAFNAMLHAWLQYVTFLYGLPEYVKTGVYVKELGGLDSEKTNQQMWKLEGEFTYQDITSRFWKKRIEETL